MSVAFTPWAVLSSLLLLSGTAPVIHLFCVSLINRWYGCTYDINNVCLSITKTKVYREEKAPPHKRRKWRGNTTKRKRRTKAAPTGGRAAPPTREKRKHCHSAKKKKRKQHTQKKRKRKDKQHHPERWRKTPPPKKSNDKKHHSKRSGKATPTNRKSKLSTVATPQCVQKASTRCETFQLLPMLSPSAPVVHSWPTQTA